MCLVTTAFALIGNDFRKRGIAYMVDCVIIGGMDKNILKVGKSMGAQMELRRIQSGHCCAAKPL
eukprot:4840844-Ditylum_brightwellii.AAC.1